MIRAVTLIGIALLVLDRPALAQSADPTAGLDACFRQGRLADKICEGQTDALARLECFKKTRDAQLECLTHILPGEPIAAMPPSRGAAAPPPSASSNEAPDNSPGRTGSIEQPPPPPGPSENSLDANAQSTVPGISPTGGEATARVQPGTQPMENSPTRPANWIVSETTSPIDYSPLVSAVLQATQPGDNGPTGLAISCRARRIELSLQFGGNSAWRNQPQIYFQAGDQSPVLLDWIWSPDGRIATLKNDPVLVLQSLPDGSTLRIWTTDRARQSTAFQLFGLERIRRKVATACNSPPQQAQTSSRRIRTGR